MTLNKDQVLTKFAAAALTLGVPADKTGIAAKQCFDSMARMAEKHAKEADRDRRKCHFPVLPRPAPDVALVDWLNSLSVDTQHGAILNNVRPYVPLYENDLADQEPDAGCEQIGMAMTRETSDVNVDGGTRLEKLQALGFKSETEYADHQEVLTKSASIAKETVVFSLPAKSVADGQFSGMVVDVSDGFVTQKINREGDTVKHDIARLSAVVQVRDVVDIQYQGGQGMVSGLGKSLGMGR